MECLLGRMTGRPAAARNAAPPLDLLDPSIQQRIEERIK